jgi:hypothetical protein
MQRTGGYPMMRGAHPWPVDLSYEERFDVVRRALRAQGETRCTCANVVSVGVGLKRRRQRKGSRRMVSVTVNRHHLHEHDR